ncbi:acyloxyacyl hydrolase [Roseivivax halodurans]|uniref:acyloxyacyl hydrolase n=1 Tax=Roseivivax halodurans TaxID=93683 RepID=UPI000567F3E5|nr:acyloxyacyl hydrolase [Roseivivax halodurans]
MADGTFAAVMLIAGLADMGLNHCGSPGGCLERTADAPRLSFSAGSVLERRAESAAEIYARYDPRTRFGPFGTALGLSLGEEGETWLGAGLTWDWRFGSSPYYGELHVMPGYYRAGDGFDLGGPIAFRSGLELGYESWNGWRYAVSYDHRSNAGIYDENPGVETVQFRVSVPLD